MEKKKAISENRKTTTGRKTVKVRDSITNLVFRTLLIHPGITYEGLKKRVLSRFPSSAFNKLHLSYYKGMLKKITPAKKRLIKATPLPRHTRGKTGTKQLSFKY